MDPQKLVTEGSLAPNLEPETHAISGGLASGTMLGVEGLQLRQVTGTEWASLRSVALQTHGADPVLTGMAYVVEAKESLSFVPELIRSNKQTEESNKNYNPFFKNRWSTWEAPVPPQSWSLFL